MDWTLDHHAAVPLWLPTDADPASVVAFTSRRGGVSPPPRDSLDLGSSTGTPADDVRENRRRVLHRLCIDPAALVTAGQVHGPVLRRVSRPGHVPDCDALLTLIPGLALAVATADCMALLYTAPGAVAAAHAGWRGAAAGVPGATLRALCAAAGVAPHAARVALGPCIRACCYEVGPEVAGMFPPTTVRHRAGRLHLDLPAVARVQLREAGLPDAALDDSGVCTACHPELCFSYRRDGAGTGRLWGLATLRPGTRTQPDTHAQRGSRGGL
jgi:polyphenol oxidase